MARCGCAGTGCGCAIVAGSRATVRGAGTAQNPYVVDAAPVSLQVQDTDSINLTMVGDGTLASPYIISAEYDGAIPTPDWQPAESRTWSDGTVSLADLETPTTVRVNLTGAVTGITLPTWSSADSGSIVLVLTQDSTGGRTVDWTGITWEAGQPPQISTDPAGRDLIRLFWTGLSWVGEPMAFDVS